MRMMPSSGIFRTRGDDFTTLPEDFLLDLLGALIFSIAMSASDCELSVSTSKLAEPSANSVTSSTSSTSILFGRFFKSAFG